MNKVLFIDVDGTLISFTSHKVPDSSIDALQKARENGCEIIIATGRAYTDLEDLKEIPYNAVIALNGSDCVLRDGTSIARRQIPLDDFRKALALSEEYGFPIAVENDLGIFVNRRDTQVIALAEHVNHPVPPVVDIEKMFVESKCCQLCFYCDKETENDIMRQLPHLSASRWHPIFADINVKGVDKSTGMDIFASYYGIDMSETVAFGDGGNDIPMLRKAGIGIAMGNASETVKAAAGYVTDSVDDNGIYNALKHFKVI